MSTVNLALPSVQIREIRINSITGYHGDAENLVAESAHGIRDRNRSFSQCVGCSITKAACMTILIIELDEFQVIPTKDDFDFYIINTNKILESGLTPNRLFSEGPDSPYANIVVVRSENKDNPAIKALVEELQSEETKQFILEKYNGAVIPAN